jgi:putative addiction module antidote
MELKLTTVGNSVGVVLPKELLARLRLQKGDKLFVTETADGVILRPHDERVSEEMAAAEMLMRKRRKLLHKLADS